MKKTLILFLLFFSFFSFSQENYSSNKNTTPIENRSFKDDLKSKYNSKDFQYKEYEAPKKKVEDIEKNNEANISLFKSIFNFLKTVFPYLIALIVILIIVKSVLNNEASLWDFSRKKIAKVAIVSTDDEYDIHLNDYLKLLEQAKKDGNYRKATKYYYLHLLKKMNEKELIIFDKDKTNSEYIFDLKKIELRKNFSYLLYIYDYVWYGEFNIDHSSFDTIEKKYQSFLNTL